MNLLLDTHALLWWLDDNPELSGMARSLIADLPRSSAIFRDFPLIYSAAQLLSNQRRRRFDPVPQPSFHIPKSQAASCS